jgi:phosphatidylglycerol---prolipoprotein diacylglyceryl transferase
LIPYFRPPPFEIFGPIVIQPWGFLVAMGFVLGTVVAQRYARKRGMDPRLYSDVVVWIAVGALVFGHLGHAIFYDPAYYLQKPWELLYVWSGLSSYGGFFGCAVLTVVFFKKRGINVLRGADLLLMGLTFGWFLGRIGCFVVHDHIGRIVTERPLLDTPQIEKFVVTWAQDWLGWLGVRYPSTAEFQAARAAGDDAYSYLGANYELLDTVRFDLGLMDAILAAVVFATLVFVARKPRREGVLMVVVLLMYGSVRFFLDFLRNTDLGQADARYEGLTPAQYGSIAIVVAGLLVWRESRSRVAWPEPGTKAFVDPPGA